jgi:kanosamine-6-phosphate phosphatase
MKLLPEVTQPKYIIFCDFDESYYPHETNADTQVRNIELFEDRIWELANKGEVLIGLVTGSNVDVVLKKMSKRTYRYLPHFIAGNLGTEIRYFDNHTSGTVDEVWLRDIRESGFHLDTVESVFSTLSDQNINLEQQPNFYNSTSMYSYYYHAQDEKKDAGNLEQIRTLANQYNMDVNISRCNPLAGDPEDSYDIDFLPSNKGKHKVVEYILKKYGMNEADAIAFGDSGNDLKMLQSVKHGYLLGNATEEAKSKHNKVTNGIYFEGINNKLDEFFK